MDMHGPQLADNPSQRGAWPGPDRPLCMVFNQRRIGASERDGAVGFPVEEKQPGPLSVAEASGVIEDRLEHRLNIGRRAGNHAEDLAGRRKVAIAGLQLLEQAYILDRNDRLVREGLEQLDLLRRKGPDEV